MLNIIHPHWGDNLKNQILVDPAKAYGEDGCGYQVVVSRNSFGLGALKPRRKYVGVIERVATDRDEVRRYFWHQCGLLKIHATTEGDDVALTVYLDGHVTSKVSYANMEFVISPTIQAPFADVWFDGVGARRGPFRDCHTTRVRCTFSSQEQFDQYLVVTGQIDPSRLFEYV